MCQQLTESLRREVEAYICRTEGTYTMTVLADFREGLERLAENSNDRVRYCWQWRQVYIGVRVN